MSAETFAPWPPSPREAALRADLEAANEALAAASKPLPGYFVAPDAFNDLWIWRERGDYPVPVVAQHDMRDDPELWAAITKNIEVRP